MASIETRTYADGTTVWRVRYRHNGRGSSLTFDNELDAEKWKATLEAQGHDITMALLAADQVPAGATVAAYVRAHIDLLTGVEDGTRRKYRNNVRLYLDPHPLGGMLLDDVTAQAVRAWVNWLAGDRRLSGKTIKNVHSLLSAAFTDAARHQLVAVNPAKGVRLPKTLRPEMVFLSQDEFEQLIHLTPPHYQPLVITLGGTGMRVGEATALHVGDIDLGRATARIRKAWKDTGTAERLIGLPKTSKSNRTITLPRVVVDALRPLVEGRRATDWLFVNTRGAPVLAKSFHSHPWTSVVGAFAGDRTEAVRTGRTGRPPHQTTRGEGKRPRIHDLRHSWAAWAIAAGHSLPVIQRHMGHESIQTTVDTYGHLQRAELDALAGVVQISLGAAPVQTLPAPGTATAAP